MLCLFSLVPWAAIIAHAPAGLRPAACAAACTTAVAMKLGEGAKGAAAGAVLGGLLAGPFGAIWGSQIGGSIGAAKGEERANEERLERMGLSRDMRATAAACAAELAEAEEGLKLAQNSLESARAVERNLEASASESYAAAQVALQAGDEAAAREHLVMRQQTNGRKSAAQIETYEAVERCARMRSAIDALGERAAQMEALMSRAVAGTTASRAGWPDALELEDPLLQKFKDLEG
uniref:Glycine zipper domain-containing protein n=1 Tax=Calcidiscus leptoporus TaxID=127549 RepID=A0A7S0JI77_9EUKA|mmetsp:Transcript_60234/g.138189  ORF Transcript_60234/g.138189 Transcript_60234/m.138189 type:complete len:235 (+) Transcript_60234:239-943(+)